MSNDEYILIGIGLFTLVVFLRVKYLESKGVEFDYKGDGGNYS
jgi:hypothetical protein